MFLIALGILVVVGLHIAHDIGSWDAEGRNAFDTSRGIRGDLLSTAEYLALGGQRASFLKHYRADRKIKLMKNLLAFLLIMGIALAVGLSAGWLRWQFIP